MTLTLREAFGLCPRLDVLVSDLVTHGLAGVQARRAIVPGTAIQAMLAKVANRAEEAIKMATESKGEGKSQLPLTQPSFVAEFKYDGQRAQVREEKEESGGALDPSLGFCQAWI